MERTRTEIEARKAAMFPNAIGGFGLGWNATKPQIIEEILALRATGVSVASICRRVPVSASTVKRVLRGSRPKRRHREEI